MQNCIPMLDLCNTPRGSYEAIIDIVSWHLSVFLRVASESKVKFPSPAVLTHRSARVPVPTCICKSIVVHRRVMLQT